MFLSFSTLRGEWNSIHPCMRYENGVFISGVYLNSERSISYWAGIEFPLNSVWNLELGVVTGYSGYKETPFFRVTKQLDEHWCSYGTLGVYDGQIEGMILGIEWRY